MTEENKAGKNGKKGKALAENADTNRSRSIIPRSDVGASQYRSLPPQLTLATKHDLPLFLHSRNCHDDFISILRAHPSPIQGVVHSFTGTLEEALELIDLGLYIGINGCSVKTAENHSVVERLPLESLMIESNCPRCEIRRPHASSEHLKGLSEELQEIYTVELVKEELCATGQEANESAERNKFGRSSKKITTEYSMKLFGLSEGNGVWVEEETSVAREEY